MRNNRVGDFVMHVESSNENLIKNKVYKIESISDHHHVRVMDETHNITGWYPHRFINLTALIEEE